MSDKVTDLPAYRRDRLAEVLRPQPSDLKVLSTLLFCSRASVVTVPVILMMGLVKSIIGIFEFFGIDLYYLKVNPSKHLIFSIVSWIYVCLEPPNPDRAISTIMGSVEFYLLAPLSYIVLRTLGNYINAVSQAKDGDAGEQCKVALLSVKALSMGLLIAVLATHMVSLFLYKDPAEEVLPETVSCGILLLVCLTLAYGTMEYFSHHAAKGAREQAERES